MIDDAMSSQLGRPAGVGGGHGASQPAVQKENASTTHTDA